MGMHSHLVALRLELVRLMAGAGNDTFMVNGLGKGGSGGINTGVGVKDKGMTQSGKASTAGETTGLLRATNAALLHHPRYGRASGFHGRKTLVMQFASGAALGL